MLPKLHQLLLEQVLEQFLLVAMLAHAGVFLVESKWCLGKSLELPCAFEKPSLLPSVLQAVLRRLEQVQLRRLALGQQLLPGHFHRRFLPS